MSQYVLSALCGEAFNTGQFLSGIKMINLKKKMSFEWILPRNHQVGQKELSLSIYV